MSTPIVENLNQSHPNARWTIGGHELHCGDCFMLYPDQPNLPPIKVRIEHAHTGWYLITPYGLTMLSCRKASLL